MSKKEIKIVEEQKKKKKQMESTILIETYIYVAEQLSKSLNQWKLMWQTCENRMKTEKSYDANEFAFYEHFLKELVAVELSLDELNTYLYVSAKDNIPTSLKQDQYVIKKFTEAYNRDVDDINFNRFLRQLKCDIVQTKLGKNEVRM